MAYLSAPIDVVEQMVDNWFPLSYRDSHGKMPLDYVQENNHTHKYRNYFKPKFICEGLTLERIQRFEKNFHALILETADESVKDETLPNLSVYFEEMNYQDDHSYKTVHMFESKGGIGFHTEFNEDKTAVDALRAERIVSYLNGKYVFGHKYKVTENHWEVFVGNH